MVRKFLEVIDINIGVDIGGNHVGLGIVNNKGELVKKEIVDYQNENVKTEDIIQPINKFLKENTHYNIESIGIGIPGIATNTHIDYTCNLPLGNIEISDYIDTKIPIHISNDANCAAIAEYEIIDKRLFSNYVFVTIGTGIGAGIIINGGLFQGTTMSAGEIGHMIIEKDGLKCKCGRNGCFEQYASVTALKRMTNLDSLKEIFYLDEINEVVQKVFDEYLENLAEGLANVINLFDPEMLVIGGSLSNYGYKYITKLKSKIAEKIYNKYTYDLNIKTAVLGNDAGILGAALLKNYV